MGIGELERTMNRINKGDYVRPIKDELMFIIGNKDFIVTDSKSFNKNSHMIKIEGHKLWFNEDDFENVI